MPVTLDSQGRDKARGQAADALQKLAAGERERVILSWLTMIFSAIAAVAALIAAF